MHRIGRRNATGTDEYDQMTLYKTDDSCLLKASNIHSHQHLMGPALTAGGDAEI